MKLCLVLVAALISAVLSACNAQPTTAANPVLPSVTQVPTVPPPPPRPIPPSWPTLPWQDDITIQLVENTVDAWLSNSLLVAPTPIWNQAESGQMECNRKVPDYAAFYCGPERTVYIPIGAVKSWSPNQILGDAYQAAHEATHHLQLLATGTWLPSAAKEQQANCGSGVFVKWAVVNSILNITPDEVSGLEAKIASIPDVELHNSADLKAAFDTGYQSGSLADCVPIAGPLAGA